MKGFPKHPASERTACYFHGWLALIGLAHVVGGLAMIWFHGDSARRHWADRHLD